MDFEPQCSSCGDCRIRYPPDSADLPSRHHQQWLHLPHYWAGEQHLATPLRPHPSTQQLQQGYIIVIAFMHVHVCARMCVCVGVYMREVAVLTSNQSVFEKLFREFCDYVLQWQQTFNSRSVFGISFLSIGRTHIL